MSKFTEFRLPGIDGHELPLTRFDGDVVLLVNTASRCGLTPQYVVLEMLYRRYQQRGFQVLGVPCNQFGGQEPGTEAQIRHFCSSNYGVTFTLAGKVEVNGTGRHPLYAWLAGPESDFPGDITWNFEKFLIGRDGQPRARYAPTVKPDALAVIAGIELALG